ncbi:MAG: Hsp20/alpha crystallin family protein [Verrucomicrobia bacterium]|nr:Hsp20/alpha crystallin family protein [Verrucomicrobiota bacterium]
MCKLSSGFHFTLRPAANHKRELGAEARWQPNTDVYATDGGLVVKVELAGMRSENLEINVEGNRLRINGTRPDGCRAPTCNFLVMEISYGAFETVLELPPGYDLSKAKASYLNGFLRIDVPVSAPSKAKRTKVPVKEAV